MNTTTTIVLESFTYRQCFVSVIYPGHGVIIRLHYISVFFLVCPAGRTPSHRNPTSHTLNVQASFARIPCLIKRTVFLFRDFTRRMSVHIYLHLCFKFARVDPSFSVKVRLRTWTWDDSNRFFFKCNYEK